MNHEKEFKDGLLAGVLLVISVGTIVVGLIYYNLWKHLSYLQYGC